jgi:hypothetical protein
MIVMKPDGFYYRAYSVTNSSLPSNSPFRFHGNAVKTNRLLGSVRNAQSVSGVSDWGWEPSESLPRRGGVTGSSQTAPFVEGQASFQNTQKSGKNKNTVMGSDGARDQERLARASSNFLNWIGLDSRSGQTLNCGHGFLGGRNSESLCWREPAAICWTGLGCIPGAVRH